MVHPTKYHSWCAGRLSEGCRKCVEGRKLVLFITGLCGQRCFYCPVSEEKYGSDVAYANEWQIKDPDNPVELFEEARLTQATGTGITGGDPLVKIDRCCEYIKLLKQKFGKEFHVHLYTPFKLVTEERLQKLYDAGLDEIRFHFDLDDDSLWNKLELARKFDWDIGVEIPVIPGYEEKTKKMIDFISDKVKFLNLNELELSDAVTPHYNLDFEPRDDTSYGVKGSREMALEMLEYCKEKSLPAHFCTAKLKDKVQVGNRLKLRAQQAALPFDKITDEGLLYRGVVYLDELKPGIDFKKKFAEVDKDEILGKLKEAKEKVLKFVKEVEVDDKKLRLLMSPKFVKRVAKDLKKLNLVPALVEEYPTADGLEVDVEFL